MPRVLLAGAFGQRNPGDEALLTAFDRALPGVELVVPATDPAAVATSASVRPVPNSGGTVLRELRRSDGVVFGGGTVFKLLGSDTGRRRHDLLERGLGLAVAAHALGKPVAIVGVGASALPDVRSRRLARALAARADMLVLRDSESIDLLAAAGVPVPIRLGADAAWTLLTPQAQATTTDSGRVVVTVSRHAGGPAAIPLLAAALAALARQRPDVRVIELEPWQVGGPGQDDLDLARLLHRALEVAGCACATVTVPPATIDEAAERYHDARLLVGQRFHSLVAAAAAGCRFAAVAHEAKLAGLAARLGQVALPPESGVTALVEGFTTAMDGPVPDAAVIADETESASAMLALMRTLVTGGQGTRASDVHLRALHLRPEALIR